MFMGSAPIEVNEWGGKGKARAEGEVRLWYSCQRSLSQPRWSSALRRSYRVFLNWGWGAWVLHTGINTRLDVYCPRGHDCRQVSFHRQCQFPEIGLSGRDCEAVRSTLPALADSPSVGGGQRYGQEHKKLTPFIFLGISCSRVSRDNLFPQNAQQCWSVAQALCRVSIKTISESLHGGNQPCQVSIKCTSAHSRRVKLPRL